MTNHDEAVLLLIQVVINAKLGVAAVTVKWEVWRLYSVE